jgi:AmiR/NasT family two-component response regulator
MPLTILLIDTDEDRAHALGEKLAESGFARVVRAQGPDLAAAVEQTRPDLVIVDMALPDRDALEDIRAVSAASPVVMFAGTDDPGPDRGQAEGGNQLRLLHSGIDEVAAFCPRFERGGIGYGRT